MAVNITSGKELLKRAIKGEKDGLKFYTLLANKTENRDAKRKLQKLADDEKRHEAVLIDIYKRMYNEEVGQLPKEGINALAKFFDAGKAKEKHTEMQFIDLAIEAELSATNFYKETAAHIEDGNLQKICEDLAEEEFGHYELLQAEKDAISGNYFWFGYDSGSPLED